MGVSAVFNKHIACFKQYGDLIWNTLTDSLADYQGFRGLSAEHMEYANDYRCNPGGQLGNIGGV